MSRRGNRGAISDFGKACSSRREELWLVARGVQIKTSARRRREVTCTQDHWARTGRSHLVDDYKNDPESVLVASDRLVFVSYDEQLYKDLKAHQDARVAEM